MPRSRNSRSVSPQKSVSAESLAEFEKRKILQNVHDIFCEAIDDDVIRLVLQECNWREEEAVDKLLIIAESREEQRKYKSKLHRIAEGVFGSLRSEDYGHSSVTAASSLSPSEKVIRRPSKVASGGDKSTSNSSKLHHVGSSEKLLARGLAPPIYTAGTQESETLAVDEIEMDLQFASTKLPETNISSASSSISSQKSHTEQVKPPSSSKTVLLSQAQSAFNQQFDDAEGTQRWEEYKQKLSEHYLVTLTKDKSSIAGKSTSKESFSDDPAILQAEFESPSSDKFFKKEVDRPRSETGRSFPVRLLSRSPDTVEDDVPVLIPGQNTATRGGINELMGSNNMGSSELDETVFKCIYEIHGDLLDEKELGTLTKNSESEKSTTPLSFRQTVVSPASKPAVQQSNEAMTLPTIGLSVDAEEFVPRPKSVTNKSTTLSPTEVKDSSPQPASKMPKSNSIEIKMGVKNVQRNQTTVSVGSPVTISPSISPGLSPPSTHMNSPAANLTGSPMFITPKWPQMFHTINHPPPMPPTVLSSTPSRYMNPNHAHHLSPQGYRFPPAGPLPYSSRMVYSVAPPPLFRMAGVPRYVQQPTLQVGENMEDRVAIATGQPIMATSEASRLISPSVKLVNTSYIEQKVERIQTLQKTGLKVLVIVRGLPGSGKSTLARHLQLNGIVLSTDDYFMKGNIYTYNPDKLTEAHQWNRERSKEAMKMGKSPVIIDNTNTQTWEFKPYISMAVANNYHIELVEPNTPWKYKTNELARRTMHGVPKDQIERMCIRYEHNITVETLLKKKKPESKSNDNETIEDARLYDNTLSSPEDMSSRLSPFTDMKGVKDLRFHNSSKVDDLRKQRSAESDSDSISSYHSGSLSNQSSRNASPKPLRPSLKTPGALQKIEKQKPPVMKKQVSVKPGVKRIDRKTIKKIESNLSQETVQAINEMVNEHVGDRILSIENVTTLEEELKALLMLYPLNDSEVPSAEELIGLKLHDIIYQSSEIPEADDDVETSDAESAKDISNDEIKFELPCTDEISKTAHENKIEREFEESLNIEMIENESKTCEILEEHANAIEINLLKNGLHNECEAMQTVPELDKHVTTSSERIFPSWTEIASVASEKGSKTFVDMGKDCIIDSFGFIENESSNEDKICVPLDDFESEYWGTIVENSNVSQWDNNECAEWDGNASNLDGDKGAKPQRKKRNKSSDIVLHEVNTLDNEILENNNVLPKEAYGNEYSVDCSEEIKEKEHDKSGTCLNDDVVKDVFHKPDSDSKMCTSISEEVQYKKNKQYNSEVENTAKENSNNEKVVCSSVDTNRSQDRFHVTSLSNSSLQMLKESYIERESAIQSDVIDKEEENELHNLVEGVHVNVNELKPIKIDNDVESETLSVEKSNCININGSGENLEENSMINVKVHVSQDNGERLKVVKSNESLTPSEDSDKEFWVRHNLEKELSSNNAVHSLPQKSKKPSRRKMAANLMGPFLKQDDKEKFKTEAWNSFPIHSVEKQSSTPFTDKRLQNEKEIMSKKTMTDVEYFDIVLRLNQGGFVDSSIKYLSGNPKKLINGLNTNIEINSVNEIHTLEKSTSTDDFVTMTDSESVEFLHTCFPTIPKAELECVLEICANNCEWATNLLLDWKYYLPLTLDEKRKFTEGMAEVKKGSSQGIDEQGDLKNDSGPNSLLDICFNLVEKKKIASREEIERQLIQTGKERLDRIEDDHITKIRLRRSTSLSESSFDIGSFTPKKNDLSVYRSNSSPAQIRESVEESAVDNDSAKVMVNENDIKEHITDKADSESRTLNYVIDQNSGTETVNEHKKAGSNLSNNVDVTDRMVSHVAAEEYDFDIKPAVSINVDAEMIGKLEDMFGPLGNRSDVKNDISVPLDRKTAWNFYQCIKKGIILSRSQQRREQQQLIKDEALARQLQEEENAYIKPGIQTEDNVPRGRKGTPLVGLSVVGTIPQQEQPVAWNRGNQTLAEIMREERRIQDSQKEFLKLIENEGGQTAMATCLERQKLYGRFPTLDKKLLDEIFQANCFSLSETIDSISTSLGEGHMETTVSMATNDQVQEEKLLEATKQQSMQEMLDSYIYHPVVSKDYQDGAEPEYEDYRGEANLHFRLRHECFQKAREAHRRGLKQVATFYSQQGHKHTQKIKEANMRASENILADRNHDIERNTLDLHGLHVDEAIAALNRIIPEKERDRCKKLIIITGRGSHSRGGVPRLRRSVIGYLNTNKYSYTELSPGVFNVSLKKYRSPDK